MKVLLVLVALAAVAFAQTAPQLNDAFTANVNFVEKFGSTSRSLHGSWFFDYVGRQERFNAQSTRGLLDLFRFYNTSKEYEVIVKSDLCKGRTAQGKFFGVFDWLKYAKANGQCQQNGNSGATGNAWQAPILTHFSPSRLHLFLASSG